MAIEHNDPLVQRVGKIIAEAMADLEKLFKHPVRMTLVVRRPNFPEQDVVVTSDLLGDAIKAIEQRMAAEAIVPRPASGDAERGG